MKTTIFTLCSKQYVHILLESVENKDFLWQTLPSLFGYLVFGVQVTKLSRYFHSVRAGHLVLCVVAQLQISVVPSQICAEPLHVFPIP